MKIVPLIFAAALFLMGCSSGKYTPVQSFVAGQMKEKDFGNAESVRELEQFLLQNPQKEDVFDAAFIKKNDFMKLCLEKHCNSYLAMLLAGTDVILPDIDSDGANYLHLAIKYEDFAALKLLIPHIRDINSVNSAGQTAFFYATVCPSDYGTVKMLLESGSDKTIRDIYGNTAAEAYVFYFPNSYDPEIYNLVK